MKSKRNKILLSSLTFNIVAIVAIGIIFFRFGGATYLGVAAEEYDYKENPHYIERTELFDSSDIQPNAIVFVGDSMVQRGLWDEMITDTDIVNRGINSDVTEGVKNRMDEIISSKPKAIFLMIGINDLYRQIEKSKTSKIYKEILSEIKNESPDTQVYVQSILPINNDLYYDADLISNEDVMEMNKIIKNNAEEFGYEYIDVYSKVSKDNQLLKELTTDGLHLNGEGYMVWKNILEEELKEY